MEIESDASSNTIFTGDSLTLNCTVPGIPEELIPLSSLYWTDPSEEFAASDNETTFLELELLNVEASDSGIYRCSLEIVSDLFEEGSAKFSMELMLDVEQSMWWRGFGRRERVVEVVGKWVGKEGG